MNSLNTRHIVLFLSEATIRRVHELKDWLALPLKKDCKGVLKHSGS